MKKTNGAIYIPNMDAKEFDKICAEKGLQFIYTTVPSHGRLIDADELYKVALERSETKDGYYNCLDPVISCYAIDCAPTVIPAEEGE